MNTRELAELLWEMATCPKYYPLRLLITFSGIIAFYLRGELNTQIFLAILLGFNAPSGMWKNGSANTNGK